MHSKKLEKKRKLKIIKISQVYKQGLQANQVLIELLNKKELLVNSTINKNYKLIQKKI